MGKETEYQYLVENSARFRDLKRNCLSSLNTSFTGMVNLVINHEDQCLIDAFLKFCFTQETVYGGCYGLDAIELQSGAPGAGNATSFLDSLIYGSYKVKPPSPTSTEKEFERDQNGKRKRQADGFVSRKEVAKTGTAGDRIMIIKNLDYCMDFCHTVGTIDPRSLWILDNFRDNSIRLGCKLLLVTNKKLEIPFSIRTVNLDPVSSFDAECIINGLVESCKNKGYVVNFTNSQKRQICRKLSGLTHSESCDALADALTNSKVEIDGLQTIEAATVVKTLRNRINRLFMENSFGLTHLTPRPWEDYICSESSNFTYDVKKIYRDFNEINRLRSIKTLGENSDLSEGNVIDAIRSRMPHVIVLYGRGGVGKSAFPIHLAGLLDFDVWDFNINAIHSKWVGEGPERMRDALKKIIKSTHVIVRIDEYDRAIGSGASSGQGMHEAHKQVESEFMNWLQNCQEDNLFIKNDIFLVLTTNNKDNITGPMLRSGRADLVIDINEFDKKSMIQTFLSAPRRMSNRGACVVGFDNMTSFESEISKLDLDKMAGIATSKGFTVRDVDMLLLEMAGHNYYYKQTGEGIKWSSENFISVLENSSGSALNENTSELILGDRFLLQSKPEVDAQMSFGFYNSYNERFDEDKFIQSTCFV